MTAVAGSEDLRALGALLTTRWLGRPHEHVEVVGSTNDRAAQWGREGAPHGALVTADAQQAGRGRRGRTWSSPPGVNIYASCLLRPPPVPEGLGPLALAVALGLHRGLGRLTDVPGLAIKWPNDLLIAGRKVAGILCECRWMGDQPEVTVGFGINVHPQWFPPDLRVPATTLADAGMDQGRTDVLAVLLAALEPTLETFFEDGFGVLHADYVDRCPWLGGDITWTDAQGVRRRVRALHLDPSGALVIRDGLHTKTIEAGEIWL